MASPEAEAIAKEIIRKGGKGSYTEYSLANFVDRMLATGLTTTQVVNSFVGFGEEYAVRITKEREERQKADREKAEREQRENEGREAAGLPPLPGTNLSPVDTSVTEGATTTVPSSGSTQFQQRVAALEGAGYVVEIRETADGAVAEYVDENGRIQSVSADIDGNIIDFTGTTGGAGSLGSGGGGGGSRPSYSTEIIGGQVYRINSETGIPEPTGVMVPAGVVSTETDKNGNLIGFKSDGTTVVLAEGFGFEAVDPNFSTVTDDRTGITYRVDNRTGERVEIGQYGYAGIDPERDQQLAEREQTRLEAATRLDEEIRRRERSLAENDAVAGILSRPADFLARAFLQRGVETPLQQVTQADLVGSLRNAISSASGGTVTPAGAVSGVPGGAVPTPVTTAVETVNTPTTGTRLPSPQEVTAELSRLNAAQRSGAIDAGQAIAQFNEYRTNLIPVAASSASAGPAVVPSATPAPLTTNPNPLMNIQSQDEIIEMARKYSPPAVNAVIDGTTERLKPLNLGFAAPTPRQLSRLTGAETEALGTRLAAEFNTDLGDLADQQRNLYGSNRSVRKSRLVV